MKTKLDFMRPTNVFLLGLGLLLPIQPNLRAQPVPHHFTSIVKLPDNTIALTLDGRVATSFNSYFDLYVLKSHFWR